MHVYLDRGNKLCVREQVALRQAELAQQLRFEACKLFLPAALQSGAVCVRNALTWYSLPAGVTHVFAFTRDSFTSTRL